MGWAIGYLDGRDVGYGVPATCEQPECKKKIDRGLAYKCGEWRSDDACGLYFCGKHLYLEEDSNGDSVWACDVCCINMKLNRIDSNTGYESFAATYPMKPDRNIWVRHKLKHSSWQEWRDNHPEEVKAMKEQLGITV